MRLSTSQQRHRRMDHYQRCDDAVEVVQHQGPAPLAVTHIHGQLKLPKSLSPVPHEDTEYGVGHGHRRICIYTSGHDRLRIRVTLTKLGSELRRCVEVRKLAICAV